MPLAAQIFAGIAAALHVLFFYLESVVFTKNGTYKSFGVATQQDAEVVKPMALNQGFYNLFLAIGVIVGIVLVQTATDGGQIGAVGAPLDAIISFPRGVTQYFWGEALVTFGCACMAGAALVLLVSSKGRLLRGVLIQGLAPTIALIIIAVA